MDNAATKLATQKTLDEILAPAKRVSSQQKTSAIATDARFEAIVSNPFYSTVFNTSITPEEKTKAIATLLTDTGVKEQNKENTKAFELFKEYLQSVREKMASEIIRMSDTKNFSMLRDIYEDINKSLDDFENDIKPLTDIIDALFKLRAADKTVEALDDIKTDKAREESEAAAVADLNKRYSDAEAKISSINKEIARLSTEKSLFGFGGIKKESQARIAELNIDLIAATNSLDDIQKEYDAFNNKVAAEKIARGDDPDIINAKAKLRELLDISSPEHEERSKRLISSALNFVNTSKEKVGEIRTHLGQMDDQIGNLNESNQNMNFVYALANDGTKIAEDNNKSIREALTTAKENESTIDRLTRENRLRDIDEHITYLEASATDTVATMADLTSASIRIKAMEDSNKTQMQKAKDMQARGVAGVADRISTVIQAVGAAAIGESSNMVGQNLQRITQSTNEIVQKESMRGAMAINDRNEEMLKAIDALAQYGEVSKASTEVTKAGLAEMRENLERMEETVQQVAKGVNESYAAAADVISGANSDKAKAGAGTLKKDSTPNPFVGLKKVV